MIVVLYNIRSIYNVGAIFRTADALKVEKICLVGITPAPCDEFGRPRQKFIKVSLGAEKSVPWERIKNLRVFLKKLKKLKYKIFAVEQSKNSVPYYKVKLKPKEKEKIVLILGNELKGLPRSLFSLADKILEIPMRGRKKSLNVGISFAIVAFGLTYC